MNDIIKKADKSRLWWLGFIVVSAVVFPVLFLYIRDGQGSGVFPFHDQLDETILSYVFGARHFGSSVYEQMMCGISAVGLKPSAPLFVPLYSVFNVYVAFLLQYVIVVATAFFGMYFCCHFFTGSSIAAVLAASLFAFLPFHSIYGNIVSGTPLLILCFFRLRECRGRSVFNYLIGIIYYAATAHIVLTGWVALAFAAAMVFWEFAGTKKFSLMLCGGFATLFFTYVAVNFDLIMQVISPSGMQSHRLEYEDAVNTAGFFERLRSILIETKCNYDVDSKHLFVFIAAFLAVIAFAVGKKARKHLKAFVSFITAIFAMALIYAFFSVKAGVHLIGYLPGILGSFQFSRVYYTLPGLWFILLGISMAAIIEAFRDRTAPVGIFLAGVLAICVLNDIARDKEGIFYQNINQINNGEAITGYITMRNVYAENLMSELEHEIGEDMKTYRVAHIGMSPVASLMHGFYTIDGYSNNYSLEYKHTFRDIVAGELELNDYTRQYFDGWGGRCYIFYHEWGNAYMLRKGFSGTITDLRLDFDKMKELNCKYIFSVGKITEPSRYGLEYRGYFADEDSYWGVYLYELK